MSNQPKQLKAVVLERHQIEDEQWNEFIARSPQAAPYGCTWYLDVVWPGWKAVVFREKERFLAVLPIKVSKKYGLSYVFNPPYCQYVGLFFDPAEKKSPAFDLAYKKRLAKAIVESIPLNVKLFNVKFAPTFDYPLPFHWAGYQLHTRYSYWLDNQADKAALFKNLEERTRTYINKAIKSGLVVQMVEDIEAIVSLAQKRNAFPLDADLLKRLWTALRQQKIGTALEVRDGQGRLHAALIYQQFQDQRIHLFSAFDADLGSLGGMSLAIWHSIETAGPEVKVIDFEGSMLEPVENFFRNFGTRPVPYLQIKKNAFPKPIQWLFDR